MAYEYMEDVLDAFVTYLTNGLEATLVTIEANRSVTIPRWKTLAASGTRGNLGEQYPGIIIAPGGTDPDYGDEFSPLTEHWNYHELEVQITHAGGDWKAVEYALLRYDEAIQRLVEADAHIGTGSDNVDALLGRMDAAALLRAISDKEHKQTLIRAIRIRVLDA